MTPPRHGPWLTHRYLLFCGSEGSGRDGWHGIVCGGDTVAQLRKRVYKDGTRSDYLPTDEWYQIVDLRGDGIVEEGGTLELVQKMCPHRERYTIEDRNRVGEGGIIFSGYLSPAGTYCKTCGKRLPKRAL